MKGYRVGEEEKERRAERERCMQPPPPPKAHGHCIQRQFHRKCPDMNIAQGDGNHLEYLMDAYQNGTPFTEDEMEVSWFAKAI